MYICKNCKNVDKFELMFSPEYEGGQDFRQVYNEYNEIEITIDGYTFIPDLEFMNKHAVCRYCGQIYVWEKE